MGRSYALKWPEMSLGRTHGQRVTRLSSSFAEIVLWSHMQGGCPIAPAQDSIDTHLTLPTNSPSRKSQCRGMLPSRGRCSSVKGPVMDTRRSFYLASRQDDFAEPAADLSPIDSTDIPYVMPANDNLWTKDCLSARCGALLRRLIALRRLN